MTEANKQQPSRRTNVLSDHTLAIAHRRKLILKVLISDDPAKRLDAKKDIIQNYPMLAELSADPILSEQDNSAVASGYAVSLRYV